MNTLWILGAPGLSALAALGCAIAPGRRLQESVHAAGSAASFAAALILVARICTQGTADAAGGFFFMDPLSAVIVLIDGLVGLATALYSIGHIREEIALGRLSERQAKRYFVGFQLFAATLYFVPTANNLGILWVAIEATTVSSAFLVALYRSAESLEAAWKYLILCSVGIAFALLGLIVLYSSAVQAYGPAGNRLDFTFLASRPQPLPIRLTLTSFVLILAGYGTKAGLAPLHFWLPDAHSQSPSPVSAMLSGALLSTALFGVLRAVIVANHAAPAPFVSDTLIAFGLLSLFVAFPFLLLQNDVKRMLAFSSIEQMGILVFGAGIGGRAGFIAVTLQMFNHAMAKSTMFMAAGNLALRYGTKNIRQIRGSLRAMPFTASVLLLCALALTGAPPFSLFTSEFLLTAAGFAEGRPIVTAIFLLLLAAMFGVMLYQTSRMLFGRSVRMQSRTMSLWTAWPLLMLIPFFATFGVFLPHFFQSLFYGAANVLEGRAL